MTVQVASGNDEMGCSACSYANQRIAFRLAISLSFLLAVGSSLAWAEPKEILSSTSINVRAKGIAVDGKGIYVVGSYCPTFSDCEDVIEKRFMNGNPSWRRRFSMGTDAWVYAIVTHTSGIYVAGSTKNSTGGSVGIIRKYDFSGNPVWTYANPINTGIQGISVDDTGVYFYGGATFIAGHERVSVGHIDFLGNEVWLQFMNGFTPNGTNIALHQGTLFLVSRTNILSLDQYGNWLSNLDLPERFVPGKNALVVDNSGIYISFLGGFISKLGFDGSELWRHQIARDTFSDDGPLAIDEDGIYYVGESEDNNIDVRAFDKEGNELWRRQGVYGDIRDVTTWGGKIYAAGPSSRRYGSSGGLLLALGPVKPFRRIETYHFTNEEGVLDDIRGQCSGWYPGKFIFHEAKFIFPVVIANPDGKPLRRLQFLVRKLGHYPNEHAVLSGDEWAHRNSRILVPMIGAYADGVLSAGESVEVPVAVCQRQDYRFKMTLDLYGTTAVK